MISSNGDIYTQGVFGTCDWYSISLHHFPKRLVWKDETCQCHCRSSKNQLEKGHLKAWEPPSKEYWSLSQWICSWIFRWDKYAGVWHGGVWCCPVNCPLHQSIHGLCFTQPTLPCLPRGVYHEFRAIPRTMSNLRCIRTGCFQWASTLLLQPIRAIAAQSITSNQFSTTNRIQQIKK